MAKLTELHMSSARHRTVCRELSSCDTGHQQRAGQPANISHGAMIIIKEDGEAVSKALFCGVFDCLTHSARPVIPTFEKKAEARTFTTAGQRRAMGQQGFRRPGSMIAKIVDDEIKKIAKKEGKGYQSMKENLLSQGKKLLNGSGK